MIDKTLVVILAGGTGKHLYPLTAHRTKPAVPFGGKYRIIDFALTNCLNSGLRQILVLTQYKSHSLLKHLRDAWSIYNPELGEYITPVPPQMRTGEDWYIGTANAVFQNLFMLERSEAEWILVLSGDHIYRMDYAAMLKFHRNRRADATVACTPVSLDDAKGFSVLGVDTEDAISGISEDPDSVATSADHTETVLVSMGIYVFPKKLLLDSLMADHANANSGHDFEQDILPKLIASQKVYAYQFGGPEGRVSQDRYWKDIGTLDAYYDANMALLDPMPTLDLYQRDWNIRTYQGQNPPARTVSGTSGNEGIFINSIAADGTLIAGGAVSHSIMSPNVYIGDSAVVDRAILFDGVEVGSSANVRNCIIDKEVKIPAGEQIGIDPKRDRDLFTVTPKGIVVVPKGFASKEPVTEARGNCFRRVG